MINHLIYNLPGARYGNLFPEYFDKILVDAPCTALGTLSTNREIWQWWSHEKLNRLIDIQKTLLISALKALKVGGELVYSTCSLAPEENEFQIENLCRKYPVEIVPPPNDWYRVYDHGFSKHNAVAAKEILDGSLRVYPHRHGQEGFYMVKLRKVGSVSQNKKTKAHSLLQTYSFDCPEISSALEELSGNWGMPVEIWNSYRYFRTKERIWMFNPEIVAFPEEQFLNGGLLLAEKRLHMWKLSHQSVQFFSNYICKRNIELGDEELISLLAKGQIDMAGIENGYYALEKNRIPFASIFVQDGMCKIRLPHSFRLVL
jgi:16S rRNA (cytosine1407-C5)-methyltransferase